MEKVIIVSADGHAGMPPAIWSEYLDARYHDFLPALHEEAEVFGGSMGLLNDLRLPPETYAVFDLDGRYQAGRWKGLWNAEIREQDMDREGVTAELIYHGDFRLGDMFHNTTNNTYPLDAWAAGARAWNRWAADNFGFAMERFLVTGAIGPCADMEQTLRDLDWIADHKFTATYLPGYMKHPDMPPVYDPYWDRFWSKCTERGIALVVHAGYGTDQGVVFPQLQKILDDVARAAGSTDLDALFAHGDAIQPESFEFFTNFLVNVNPRRPMWQMMLGGVFDRHPHLKLILTEIRLDWIPATLRHLDAIYDERHAELPAKRTPTEYWATNCLAGASFIHKAEVEMRQEIGLHTVLFGRDFPHPEGTWPNTKEYLRAAFDGVPEDELRMMLGENAITFLGLDRDRLAEIARRIGPRVEDITGDVSEASPELIESFDQRSGYLKPLEGGAKLPMVDELIEEDLVGIGANA